MNTNTYRREKKCLLKYYILNFRMTPTAIADGGLYYQGGCRVHGTSIVLPEDEDESQTLFPQPTTNGGHRGLVESMRRRTSHSQSVRSSPLASPVPPLGPAPPYDHSNCSDRMHKSCACVNFIAEHTKAREEATKVKSFSRHRSLRCCRKIGMTTF